jgi:hypothetical protein
MPFVNKDVEGAYARRVLKHAQIRAMARRQLMFSIPIVIVALFVAIISTFSVDRATRAPSDHQQVPVSAPVHHHAVVLV